jgi:hypothetical protein
VLYVLQHGSDEADISFTGHAVSNADLDALARHPRLHVNGDALPTIRRGDEALVLAASFGMQVTQIHFHFGYGSASASNHCMRGSFTEHVRD